jgi:hypothetical protein
MEIAYKLNREELNDKIPYAVIVERWEKKNFGREKAKYWEEFSPKERRELVKWNTKFYKWYLVKGLPDFAYFNEEDLKLLERAGNFFASI